MALRCRRIDDHLLISERVRRVFVPRLEQHSVPPANALGEGSLGREVVGLDPATEATGHAGRDARMLRSPTR